MTLQISQMENPMFSATIDQIRLRRATDLPVFSQKTGSSGFHSEIQRDIRYASFTFQRSSFGNTRLPASTPRGRAERVFVFLRLPVRSIAVVTGRAGAP